jgi:hypothetical protein
MTKHWPEVCRLAEALMYYLKRKDNDGIDVRFTFCGYEQNVKTTKDLKSVLQKHRPSSASSNDWRVTDMFRSLSRIMGADGSYRKVLEDSKHHRNKTLKKAIVFVFTDGAWQPGSKEQVEGLVQGIVSAMDDYDPDQFGLQFIRFGNDPHGAVVLKHLDDEILDRSGQRIQPDIVDTEPYWNCNVLKILQASINTWFDEQLQPDDPFSPRFNPKSAMDEPVTEASTSASRSGRQLSADSVLAMPLTKEYSSS